VRHQQETEVLNLAQCLKHLRIALPLSILLLLLLLLLQTASNLVKGQVKQLSDMRVQSIKHHDPGLEMPDVPPEEAWSVQLFRTIDSSTCCIWGVTACMCLATCSVRVCSSDCAAVACAAAALSIWLHHS
jgi:hypothetical protein